MKKVEKSCASLVRRFFILLALYLFAIGGCATRSTPPGTKNCNAGGSVHLAVVIVTTERPEYEDATDIVAVLELKNIGNEELAWDESLQPLHGFDLVPKKGGVPIGLTAAGQRVQPSQIVGVHGYWKLLRPGEVQECRINIGPLFDFVGPGDYTLEAHRLVWTPKGQTEQLTSNIAHFQLK
jgi:hypothetical protein